VISPTHKPVYDNTHTYNREISITPAGFKPATPTSEQPQIHALDRAAIGILASLHKYKISMYATLLKIIPITRYIGIMKLLL
jgi:hypothetical protein